MRNPAKTKPEILKDIQDEWGRFSRLTDRIAAGEKLHANAVGTWSVKEVLSHLAGWHDEVKAAIARFTELGKGSDIHGRRSIERFNDRQVALMETLSLSEVQEQLWTSYTNLVGYLNMLSDDIIEDQEIRELIEDRIVNHYSEHRRQLERWWGVRHAPP